MTAELWAAILTCLGGLGGTVKWAVGRWERGQRRVAHELFETRVLIAALLERERIRDVRRRRDSENPPIRGRAPSSPAAVPEEIAGESTDIIVLMDQQREVLSKRRSERPPREAAHHDHED